MTSENYREQCPARPAYIDPHGLYKNCLVIGGGAVGVDFHVPRLFDILGCETITVVESNKQRRLLLRKKFSDNRNIHFDAEVTGSKYDLAVIATPPKFHLPVYEQIYEYSRDVIIEKPLAITLAESIAIRNLSGARGQQVFVCLIRRTLQHFRMVAAWREAGTLGDLISLRVAEGNIFNWSAVSLGSFSRDLNGGGVLMDTGPHTIDQIYQVFDSVTLVSAKMDAPVNNSSKVIEANVFLELEADGGVPVNMMLSRNRKLSNTAVFEFEKADVILGLFNNQVEIRSRAGPVMTGFPGGLQAPRTFADLFDAFYRNYIAGGDNSEVSPDIAVKSLQVIEQAYNNASFTRWTF